LAYCFTERENDLGRYLDIAKAMKGHLVPDLGYEINEINEISPLADTWGAAAPAKIVLLHCPPGVPEAWAQGVADLFTMAPPTPYTVERWMGLREDSYRFVSGWAAQARRLGWADFEVFGVHHTHPWARLDCMGLVPLLQGREVVALSEGQATIKTVEDRVLTYRRKNGPRPDGVCLLWELSQ